MDARPPRAADAAALLAAYDAQLRTDAEVAGALAVERAGPLLIATFPGGRGFVTYRNLGVADDAAGAERLRDLVALAVAHLDADPSLVEVEWKTRGHDIAPGLHDALLDAGFEAEEPESIMIGEARALIGAPTPPGVVIRRVTAPDEVRAASFCTDRGFGVAPDAARADERVESVARGAGSTDCTQMWVAEVDGQMVSAGRLEPVTGTEFAGIWGGATIPEFRGRGIYRAVLAARAEAALSIGRTLIHSDSTEDSRPILERSGFVRVSTTTPYVRRR